MNDTSPAELNAIRFERADQRQFLRNNSGSLAMLAAIRRASSRVRPACRHPRRLFFGRINLVVPSRQRIADDLPSQEDTSSSECISIAVAKDDDIFRHKNCYEVIAVTTKRHATSRLLAPLIGCFGHQLFRTLEQGTPSAEAHTPGAQGSIGGHRGMGTLPRPQWSTCDLGAAI